MADDTVSTASAPLWVTPRARDLAREIAELSTRGTLYCGPAVVGWIAAVWNEHRRRDYDVPARLTDKRLFPDGPRMMKGKPPFFRSGLHEVLLRETGGELGLARRACFRYGTVLGRLAASDLPVILRMYTGRPFGQWHYTALCNAERTRRGRAAERATFHWMDNGVYGRRDGGNPALYTTRERRVRPGMFLYGAKAVVRMASA